MASFVESGALDASNAFNFHDNDFNFAFAVEGFLDSETKEDSRYVKWLARLLWKHNGVAGETIVPYHYCTAEDLQKFAPPIEDSAGLFQIYMTSETRHLYCLDLD